MIKHEVGKFISLTMSQPKITLHWLSQSRSHRVVWLLEELNLKYDVKVYNRTKEYRAPNDLLKVHPLGKSPLLEIHSKDGGKSEILAESGHIFSYLLRNFDKENKLKGNNEQVDYYLHFTEGSFQGLQVSLLINDMAVQKTPFGAHYLVKGLLGIINRQFYIPESIRIYDFIESTIKQQHESGSDYIVGNTLTAADIILSFPINNMFDRPDAIKRIFGNYDVKAHYPHIYKWNQVIQNNSNMLKANEVINRADPSAKL